MKNKLGLAIHPWWINGELNKLEQELHDIEAVGADYAEIVLHALDAVVGGKIVPIRLKQIKAILQRHALRYTLHLPYELNLLHPKVGKMYENVFKAGIEFAKETGCEVIVYHASFASGNAEILMQQELSMLHRLLDVAEGILICMENGPFYDPKEYSMGNSATKMADFCRLVNRSNFQLAFDVGHNFMCSRQNASAMLTDLTLVLPYIGHIHLHDNFGLPVKMEDTDYSHRIVCGAADIHLPLGWGAIPIADVLTRLNDFSGILILEIEKRFDDQYLSCLNLIRQFNINK